MCVEYRLKPVLESLKSRQLLALALLTLLLVHYSEIDQVLIIYH